MSHPTAYLWQKCLSVRSQFCEAVVSNGFLTREQMANAASRYRLGATRRGGVIFWQIDREGRVHDGKVMYYLPDCHRNKSREAHPTWVSTLLRRRELFSAHPSPQTSHCLFGLHLLDAENPVLSSSPRRPPSSLARNTPTTSGSPPAVWARYRQTSSAPCVATRSSCFPTPTLTASPTVDGVRQPTSSCTPPSGRTHRPSASLPCWNSGPPRSRSSRRLTSSTSC